MNHKDTVPLVPPSGSIGFVHAGQLVSINSGCDSTLGSSDQPPTYCDGIEVEAGGEAMDFVCEKPNRAQFIFSVLGKAISLIARVLGRVPNLKLELTGEQGVQFLRC